MDFKILWTCFPFIFMVFLFTLKMDAVNGISPFWDSVNRVRHQFPIVYIRKMPNEPQHYNLLSSPVALRHVLLATALIAKGKTREDIEKLLYGGSYSDLVKIWKYSYTRGVVNTHVRVFLNKQMDVTPCVAKWISKYTRRIDYSDKENSSRIINNWVLKVTNYSIPQIVLPKFHDPNLTFLTLVHVNFLQRRWIKPFVNIFPINDTSTGERFLADMLHQDNVFLYGNLTDLGVIAIELRLTKNTRMVVLQPTHYSTNFRDLKKKLVKVDIAKLSSRLTKTEISLYFPQLVSVKMDRSIIPTMQKFGVRMPFVGSADYRNLHACGEESYIKLFNQRSRISTNRNGLRVGSATGLQWALPGVSNDVISGDDDEQDEQSDTETQHQASIVKNRIYRTPKQNITKVILVRPFLYAIIHDDVPFWLGTIYKPNNIDKDLHGKIYDNDF